ncbi:MAG: flagellar hook-length control protein FliK [Lachnospiraceae bacterium]|nr:flagellar hook-length control protein FliK [Lachnospiraceae bacterium]
MTTTPVNSLTNMFNNATGTNATANREANKSFTQVLGNVTNAKTENNQKSVQTYKKTDVKIQNTSNASIQESKQTEQNNAVSRDMLQKVEEKAEVLIEKVAEELDVSVEEVEKAMEMLGMTAIDLLNTDMLSQLVVQLSGENDMMSLVMDEELYGKLNNLLEAVDNIVNELSEEFHVPADEMKDIMSKLAQQMNLPEQEVTTEVTDVSQAGEQTNVTTAENIAQSEQTLQSTGEDDEVQVIVENNASNRNEEPEKTETNQPLDNPTETEAIIEKPVKATTEQNNGNEEQGSSESTPSFLQGLTEQAAKMADEMMKNVKDTTFASAFQAQDTESIMRQMTDFIKLNVNPNVTEMELQLQPANLGTINLQVASKNGAITAQFTAQNESVKEALETQIVQLKENLEERGIKVDAVEVAVSSHEFERNLEQGEQEARDSERTEEIKRTTRRRIVLGENGIDAEAEMEDMEDADRIQVEMMQQKGNTVSFTA